MPWLGKMRAVLLSLLLSVCALIPFLSAPKVRAGGTSFPGFPDTYDGQTLTKLPLTSREVSFLRDFPGEVGRFHDGKREIIMRWIRDETRKLHPASDCFRGAGYRVDPRPLERDRAGRVWGCFNAMKTGHLTHVCELIVDERGLSWSDPSAWFWSALLGKSHGPWWAVTVAESE